MYETQRVRFSCLFFKRKQFDILCCYGIKMNVYLVKLKAQCKLDYKAVQRLINIHKKAKPNASKANTKK